MISLNVPTLLLCLWLHAAFHLFLCSSKAETCTSSPLTFCQDSLLCFLTIKPPSQPSWVRLYNAALQSMGKSCCVKKYAFSWMAPLLQDGEWLGPSWGRESKPHLISILLPYCVRSPSCLGSHQPVPLLWRKTGSFLTHSWRIQSPAGICIGDKLLLKGGTHGDIFRLVLSFCLRNAFPSLWVKRALCRWLEKGGLEGYKNTITPLGLYKKLHSWQSCWRDLRLCMHFSDCVVIKDLKQLVLQLFSQRGKEGKHLYLQMLESATASRWVAGREHDVPECMRMCPLYTAHTTICIWIEYPKPFDPRCFKCPIKLISVTFLCIMAQDFFLYLDLSERRREQPEMAGNGDCFKPLHPPSSRLLEPE